MGLERHQAGKFSEAEAIYRKVLQVEPDNAQALYLLGRLGAQAGQYEAAVALLTRAVALHPTQAPWQLSLGEAYARWGKPEEAAAAFSQAIALDPSLAAAHTHMGIMRYGQGRLTDAEQCFSQVVRLSPQDTQARANLGRALFDQGKQTEALDQFRQAARLAPNDPSAQFNLGTVLQSAGHFEEARAAFEQALAHDPNNAQAHNNLGIVLRALNRLNQAESHYRRAIEIDPASVSAYNNLAVVLSDLNRHREAVAAYREVIKRAPQVAEAYSNLAGSLETMGEVDEAIEVAQRAIGLNAQLPQAYCNLGMCLQSRGQLDEAIEAYRTGLQVAPDDYRQHSNLVYALNYHPGYDAEAIFNEHRAWGRRHADPLTAKPPAHPNDRTPDRRLRVGYVSGHFRSHAVAAFVEPMLAAHDHEVCEVFCYSGVEVADETTRRFQACADHWRDLLGLDDQQACKQIVDDRIDVLVDLAGHIRGNRLLVFARKPAPVQVTYIGYQNTTGMVAMDYRLTDAWSDPPGTTDRYYTERLVRLPRSFFCYQPDAEAPPVSSLPAASRGHITFGSFNHVSKITPEVLATWAELLRAVPGSRLVFLAHATPWLAAHVRDALARHGIAADRVELASRRPHAEYLALISTVDVALDAFPFNGHTTTCDCLWQGVPVVMLAGKTYVSRFGSSALVNLDLQEWIATTPQQYVETAAHLASDLSRLAELRAGLRERMAASPILDAGGFTRNLEAAYREMWQAWCSSSSD